MHPAERRELEGARARSVREALGDGPELFVDANGAYSVKQAARLGRRYEDLGVTWFEEPVSSEHLESLALLRTLLTVDIAAGEYGSDLEHLADHARVEHLLFDGALALDRGALGPDLTRAGNGMELRPQVAEQYRVG